jgi:alpha-L-arabinofuranosidase
MATCFGQGSTPSAPVLANIDASQTATPISPYLYGQFLEHAGGLVYSGLWSEMLDDRKFYFPVAAAPAQAPTFGAGGFGRGFGRGGVTRARWNPIGPLDSVGMDATDPYVGDHSPEIELAGDQPRGIEQTRVNFTQGPASVTVPPLSVNVYVFEAK